MSAKVKLTKVQREALEILSANDGHPGSIDDRTLDLLYWAGLIYWTDWRLGMPSTVRLTNDGRALLKDGVSK